MKKTLLFLIFLFGIQTFSFSQWKNLEDQVFTIYGKGGLGTFLYKPQNDFKIKLGGGAGISYDYFFGKKRQPKYIGLSTGVEFLFLRSSYRKDGIEYAYSTVDDESDPFLYTVSIASLEEKQQVNMIYIPILIKARYEDFYLAAGVKPGFSLRSKYVQTIDKLKTTGTYADLWAPLENIPEHGFVNISQLSHQGPLSLRVDWALHFEFGYQSLLTKRKNAAMNSFFTASIYAEYGLRNIRNKESDRVIIGYQQEIPAELTYESVVNGKIFDKQGEGMQSVIQKMNSLSIGIKLGFSFGSVR